MTKSKPIRNCEYCGDFPNVWKCLKGTTELICIECSSPSCNYKPSTGYYSPSYARALWNRKMDTVVILKKRGIYSHDKSLMDEARSEGR